MPQFELQTVGGTSARMNAQEAQDYAPQWGIDRGPGVCMYNPPSDPANAALMVAHIDSELLPYVDAQPPESMNADSTYGEDSRQLKRLKAYLAAVIDPPADYANASELEQGVIECLFFMAPDGSQEGESDITAMGVDELDSSVWQEVRKNCRAFQEAAADEIAAAIALGHDETRIGHDFAYTATGAGVGFTDRPELESRGDWEALGSPKVGESNWDKWAAIRENSLGHKLEAAARKVWSYCDGLYLGDDESIYLY